MMGASLHDDGRDRLRAGLQDPKPPIAGADPTRNLRASPRRGYGFFYTNQVGMDLHAIPFSLG